MQSENIESAKVRVGKDKKRSDRNVAVHLSHKRVSFYLLKIHKQNGFSERHNDPHAT